MGQRLLGPEWALAGHPHLVLGPQVDNVAHVVLLDQGAHVGGAEVLEVVAADETPVCRPLTRAGRQAAEVAHVDDAVQSDPPVAGLVLLNAAHAHPSTISPTPRCSARRATASAMSRSLRPLPRLTMTVRPSGRPEESRCPVQVDTFG